MNNTYIFLVLLFIVIIGLLYYTLESIVGTYIAGTIFLIVGLCIVFNKPSIKDKLENLSALILYKFGPLFSSKISIKYAKIIVHIVQMEQDYEILKDTKSLFKITTLGCGEKPVMEWEIYRDMENKQSYDHQKVKITCRYLTGSFTVPITSVFDPQIDQVTMFIMALQKLNSVKLEILFKEKNKEES